MEAHKIDVRGLSCPEPLLAVVQTMKEVTKGEIVVLFDCEASRGNISRAAGSAGWTVVSVEEKGDYGILTLKK